MDHCTECPGSAETPCLGHGICADGAGNGRCTCSDGYAPPDCGQPLCGGLSANDPSVCNSHGVCEAPNVCRCATGYQAINGSCLSPSDTCKDKPDGIPCQDGACYEHRCEAVATNDLCSNAAALGLNETVTVGFAKAHTDRPIPASCPGLSGAVSGVDVFYRVNVAARSAYRATLTPAGTAVALAIFPSCDSPSADCRAGLRSAADNAPVSVRFESGSATSLILEVSTASVSPASVTALLKVEHTTDPEPDGDVTPDGDDTPDGDVTPDGDITPDGDVPPDGDVKADDDVTPDGDSDFLPADEDIASRSKGGGCSGVPSNCGLALMAALLGFGLLRLFVARRRRGAIR